MTIRIDKDFKKEVDSLFENLRINTTSAFKEQLKIIKKRNKDLEKLKKVVNILVNNEMLDEKYKDHQLINSSKFKDCRECHI